MPSMSSVPLYPVPNRQVTFTVTLAEPTANFVRIWCTSAPQGSELRKALDDSKDPRNRVLFYEGKGGATATKQAIFEAGGVYTFTAQEYDRGASDFGGGYQGDPDGDLTSTPVGSASTLTVYIGERRESVIRAGIDSVNLVVWVWNDTIRATTRGTHGEASPAVFKIGATARELAVVESAAVKAAALDLVDVSVATALGTAGAFLANTAGGFVKEWNDHVADSTVHQDADADNDIPTGLASVASAKALKQSVSEILSRVRNHYLNDAAYGNTVAGRDTGNYHDVSGKLNDNVNLPIIDGVSDDDAYWAQAELYRSYEAHRVSASPTGVHDSADTTNALSALSPMLEVARQIFAVWAATSPTPAATVSSGATLLSAQAGFKAAPPPT
jgi:hypothetical protein